MNYTPERAAEIVDALPVELRTADLARVLNVSAQHITRMRAGNRVPSPVSRTRAVWQRESIREWLVDRLVNRESEVVAANKAANDARHYLGHAAGKLSKPPLFPFLGII